jgi:hypothetical protein
MVFNIHTAMQNADNLDGVFTQLAIEDEMTTNDHFSVTGSDLAAIAAQAWVGGQLPEAVVQHAQVQVTLFPTPLFLGIASNLP